MESRLWIRLKSRQKSSLGLVKYDVVPESLISSSYILYKAKRMQFD